MTSYFELAKPSFFKNEFKKAFSRERINYINHIGTNKKGGFSDTPFGSDVYKNYWTVGGTSRNKRYECGSSHYDSLADQESDNNAAMVFTHHTIWFKGESFNEEEHRNRLLNKKD